MSTPRTSLPSSRNRSTSARPMNPAAPVTRTRPGASATVLHAIDGCVRALRGLRVGEIDVRWQLDVQLPRWVELHVRRLGTAVEHVTAARPVLGDEVEVPAGHLDPLGVLGEAEAEHRAVDASQLEDVLLGHDLGEGPVGRLLSGNRSCSDEFEAPVDPDRARGRLGGYAAVDLGEQPVMVERALEVEADGRMEGDDDREGSQLIRRYLGDAALHVGPVEAAVDGDHLPVQMVE